MKRTRTLLVGSVTLGLAVATASAVVTTASATTRAAAVEPCFSAGTMDLNGDGFTDAVVGDPNATVSGQAQAGRVVVLYGDADDRIGQGARQILTQADLGQTVEAGDQFGAAVATTTVDMDSCADLVVGSPGEDLVGLANAGFIHVVYGSTVGVNGDVSSNSLSQSVLEGSIGEGDRFGSVVVAGENLGQDTSVVVASAPGEDVGAAAGAGAVNIVNFSDSIPVQPRQITQNTPGIPGAAETGDRFGASLALGVDLLDDLRSWELLVGAPNEGLGDLDLAGSVTAVEEVQGFPPTDTWQAVSYNQDSDGVHGVAESGDQFGLSLAVSATNLNPGTGRRIAVGSPGETVGSDPNAGQVNLFTAAGAGLVPKAAVSQDSPGVGDSSEPGDRFGQSLALIQGSVPLLGVGVPTENVGATVDAGLVQVFPFADLDADSTLTQNSAGAAGSVAANRRYGAPVAAIEGESERAFAIGNPLNGTGTVHVSPRAGGFAARSWVPGAGGVPAGAARFGSAVAGFDDLG